MSDERFLARWSRRKQEAAGRAEPASEKTAEAVGTATSEPAAAERGAPEMELSNLPPIGSIDAATDVTAFLRQGIPQELCRAALRRAWSADPAIRDFVGLAENAWDFNDPNAMAGFGPLDYSAEQVDALVRRIVGGVAEAAETVPNAPAERAQDAAQSASADARVTQLSDPAKAITKPRLFDESAARELPSNSAASQPAAASDATEETPLPRRTHGGALPR
ncbi:DUF3306 domain-containing protein [Bradyrhizobium sp. AS23.2]|uniref:DUF3306 domain-containing protein n=1 Tax=Bradyrhizobium sp. AS23.2 TaxID=1680155 RepID=UPI00093DC37A|nr:DUF3306 domain-containing protein [Bradyrhizobium sp. AS23.2]OKO84340.1 hypothetical protein AC630_09110 [Bradyrhizobium sp. AS23.2]